MKRAIVVGAVLAATTDAASAGTFLGLGIGPDANVSDMQAVEPGGRSARLLGGYSFAGLPIGTLSIEASITGQSLLFRTAIGGEYNAKEFGLAAKYSYPLGFNFEVFGKAGVHHTTVTHDDPGNQGDTFDRSGSGLLVGIGSEFRFKLGPTRGASLFVDYTHYMATLEGPKYMDDASVGMWMLGFTVGL